jgi:uncharacterized membrane protein
VRQHCVDAARLPKTHSQAAQSNWKTAASVPPFSFQEQLTPMTSLATIRVFCRVRMMLISVLRTLLAVCALSVVTAPARAGLTVCNQTPQKATLALGRYNGAQWISQGWWHVDGNKCVEVVSGRLLARYYYLYATDSAFATWDGNKFFCVGLFETFEIEGRGHCAARGMDKRGFFEIDTGNHLNWTHILSNPK